MADWAALVSAARAYAVAGPRNKHRRCIPFWEFARKPAPMSARRTRWRIGLVGREGLCEDQQLQKTGIGNGDHVYCRNKC